MSPLLRALFVLLVSLATPALADAPNKGSGGYVTGELPLTLPGGRKLTLDGKASVRLDNEFLFTTLNDVTVFQYAYEIIGDDLYVILAVRHQVPGGAALGPSLFITRASLAKSKTTWTTTLRGAFQASGSDDWTYLFGKTLLYIQQRERVTAIDLNKGDAAWTVRAVDVAFDEPYVLALTAKAQDVLYYEKIELVGDRLVARGHRYHMNEPFVLEVDAKTGQRVHVQTKYVAPKVRPLFDYGMHLRPPVHDGPLPPAPSQPEGWDGLLVGMAALVWNTHTGEGVIWNPVARDRDAVVSAARAARYTDAAGKSQPIRWLLVIDSLQLVLTKVGMPVPAGLKKYPSAIADSTVRVEYRVDLLQTGDHVDAPAVANALGAQAVTTTMATPVKTSAGPLSPVRQKGASGVILFFWGPFLVTTDDQRSSLYTTSH